jgi:hypothetical protein
MTAGAAGAAAGLLVLSGVGPGAGYLSGVVPGLALFAAGLATLVAPLTAAVLEAAPDERTGVASAVNNMTARLAGLLGTAVLPLAAGLGEVRELRGTELTDGVQVALRISAGLCVAGAAMAFLTVRGSAPAVAHPGPAPGERGQRGGPAA